MNALLPALALPWALSACSRGPSDDPAPSAPSTSPVAITSSSRPVSSFADDDPAPPKEEGCTTGVKLAVSPAASLTTLAEACARGTRPLLPAALALEFDAGMTHESTFTVENTPLCVRVLASGESGAVIELRLLDIRGLQLAVSGPASPLAVMPPAGPICLDEAGTYRIVTRSAAHGPVALQVFRPK